MSTATRPPTTCVSGWSRTSRTAGSCRHSRSPRTEATPRRRALSDCRFQTERPFFPYREPASQRNESRPYLPRSFRVYFVSDGRAQATIGPSRGFPGQVPFADRRAVAPLLEGALAPDLIPKDAWITTFVDQSSPRPGTDELYFAPSQDQSPIIPPPVVTRDTWVVWIPVDVLCAGLLSLGVVIWLRRATKRTSIN